MPLVWTIVIIALVVLLLLTLAAKVVKQYEQGVLVRLGRVIGTRQGGLTGIIPFVDVLNRVSLRIVTMPIQSQGIITRDNVSVDVSAVAYFQVADPVKSVAAIENVAAATNQIAQTTLRKVVGQHTLDETLSETDRINIDIKTILDVATEDWGVEVTLVELGLDKNTTVVLPAPLMSTIGELGSFLPRENAAATTGSPTPVVPPTPVVSPVQPAATNGKPSTRS